MLTKHLISPLLVTLLVGASASAKPHLHDGFYLRAEVGGAYLRTSSDSGIGPNFAVAGVAPSAGLFLGGSVANGVVLGGGALAASATQPTFTLDGRTLKSSEVKTSLTHILAGPFLTIYPDPTLGFHLQIMLGVSSVSLSVEDEKFKSELGYGGSFALGWDWWVGQELSLGLSARFNAASNPDGEADLLTMTPGLVLELTFH